MKKNKKLKLFQDKFYTNTSDHPILTRRDFLSRWGTGIFGASLSIPGIAHSMSEEELFGDSVNYAMKMESNGVPGRVHCSNATVEAVKEHWAKKQSEITTFGFEERGLIDVKGYEEKQKTHFIVENTW